MDSIHAIYEDGVFKPIHPVSLPDQTEVVVSLSAEPSEPSEPETDLIVKQKAAWRELFAEIDADPRCNGGEQGWSAANNVDDVLYGGPDGPA